MNPDHHSFVEIMAWGLLVLATAGSGVMLRRAIEQHSPKRFVISGVFALIALGVYFFIGHLHEQAALQSQQMKVDAVDASALDGNAAPGDKGGGTVVVMQRPEPGTENAEAQPVPRGTGDTAAQQSAETAREAAEREAEAKRQAKEQVAAVKQKMEEQAARPSAMRNFNLFMGFLVYLVGGARLVWRGGRVTWKSKRLWAYITGAVALLVGYCFYFEFSL